MHNDFTGVFSLSVKSVKKNAIWLKIFWYKVFVLTEKKMTNLGEADALCDP